MTATSFDLPSRKLGYSVFLDKEPYYRLDCERIFKYGNAFLPKIILKTRHTEHPCPFAILMSYSQTIVDEYKRNPNITSFYLDIDDPNDGLYHLIIYLTNNIKQSRQNTKSLASDQTNLPFNEDQYQFFFEASHILQLYPLIWIIRSIDYYKTNERYMWQESSNGALDQLLIVQKWFLDLDNDNYSSTLSGILSSDFINHVDTIEDMLFGMCSALQNRPHSYKSIAKLIIDLDSKQSSDNSLSNLRIMFLDHSLLYGFAGFKTYFPPLFILIDSGFYSDDEIISRIYPKCINSPLVAHYFAYEIYKYDPIIMKNISLSYISPQCVNYDFGSFNEKYISEYDAASWDSFKFLRIHGELPDSITFFIMNDDIDKLIDIIIEPGFNIMENVRTSFYNYFLPSIETSIIKLSIFYGATKCFNYFCLNYDLDNAIAPNTNAKNLLSKPLGLIACYGGNIEIIRYFERQDKNFFISENVQASIQFNNYEVCQWILENNPEIPSLKKNSNRLKITFSTMDAMNERSIYDNNNYFSHAILSNDLQSLLYFTDHYDKDPNTQVFIKSIILSPFTFIASLFIPFSQFTNTYLDQALRVDTPYFLKWIIKSKLINPLYLSSKIPILVKSPNLLLYVATLENIDFNIFDSISAIEFAKIQGKNELIPEMVNKGAKTYRSLKNINSYQTMMIQSPWLVYLASHIMTPEFKIITNSGEYNVPLYVILAHSKVVLDNYIKNRSLREYKFSIDCDFSKYVPLFFGFAIDSNDVSDKEMIKIIHEMELSINPRYSYSKNKTVPKSFFIETERMITMQEWFMNLNKNNIKETFKQISESDFVSHKSYNLLIENCIKAIEVRPNWSFRETIPDLLRFILSIDQNENMKHLFMQHILKRKYSMTLDHLIYSLFDLKYFDIQEIDNYIKEYSDFRTNRYLIPELNEYYSSKAMNEEKFHLINSLFNPRKYISNDYMLLKKIRSTGELEGTLQYYLMTDNIEKFSGIVSKSYFSFPQKFKVSSFNPFKQFFSTDQITTMQNFASFFGAHRCLKYFDTIPNYIALKENENDRVIRSSMRSSKMDRSSKALFQFQIEGDTIPEDSNLKFDQEIANRYVSTCIEFHRYSLLLRAGPINLIDQKMLFPTVLINDNVFAFYQMLLMGNLDFEFYYKFLKSLNPSSILYIYLKVFPFSKKEAGFYLRPDGFDLKFPIKMLLDLFNSSFKDIQEQIFIEENMKNINILDKNLNITPLDYAQITCNESIINILKAHGGISTSIFEQANYSFIDDDEKISSDNDF